MRILQVVHSYPSERMGGVENLTENLSNELGRKHEVYVFYPIYRSKGNNYNIKYSKNNNVNICELLIKNNVYYRIKMFCNADFPDIAHENIYIESAFKILLERIKPDIVHFQHLLGLTMMLPLIAKQYCPVVFTINDYWLLCPTTHFLEPDGMICNNIRVKGCSKCFMEYLIKETINRYNVLAFMKDIKFAGFGKICEFYFKDSLQKRMLKTRQMFENIDKTICISKSILKKCIENKLFDEKMKVEVIYPGIAINNILRIEKTDKKSLSKIRFGFVGNISERKGVHVLIGAFKKLKNYNMELLIYGKINYNNIYHKYLIKKAFGEPNIKIMDSFNSAKDPYSNIDILVVPSVAYEGYGLVVQEAFASGIPVIASNIGALNESVRDMENGMLFKVGQSEDLAQKMKIMAENNDLIEKFKRGIKTVKDIKQYADEYEKVYHDLLILQK